MKKIRVQSSGKRFNNNAVYCVGTGRLGLALQKEYIDHLKLVQESIKFRYIRGHGLFCDDVGIYREEEINGNTKAFYNFTYLDRIFDTYLEYRIKPFIELGFMPEKMKTSDQTVFYWKGNVSPPKSYEKWAELIEETLNHLIERYGRDEVTAWPVEVWNEPNIGFWAGTMEEYFMLYDYSSRAVKKVDPRIQVGGPAICGIETERWLRAFFEHCIRNESPLDFITRHSYTANEPEKCGQYIYHTVNDPTYMIDELKETRRIMQAYPQIGSMPLHITEFNSSYVPVCPVHDTTFHAAYIARILSEAGEYADSYSYWTFSDVFEEADVPKSVFHGGFGLVALNSIKKPSFYAFEFFSNAGEQLLYRDNNMVVTKKGDRYVIIAWSWNDMRDNQKLPDEKYLLSLPSTGNQAILIKKEVGGSSANPLQTWSNMGKPRNLSREQLRILQKSAEPFQTDAKIFEQDGVYDIEITISCNHLCMLEIIPVSDKTDSYLGFEPVEFYGMK
jgi:xylan 1,4-beta-xylosidase